MADVYEDTASIQPLPRGRMRGVHRSVAQLKAAIREFIAAHHAQPKPFIWTKSADEILANIARFAQRTLDSQAAPLIARTTRSGD